MNIGSMGMTIKNGTMKQRIIGKNDQRDIVMTSLNKALNIWNTCRPGFRIFKLII